MEPNEQAESQAVELPVLTVKLNPNGSVTVNGPIQDKMLCYGMLEMAKDAISEHHFAKRLTPIKNGNGIIHRIFK